MDRLRLTNIAIVAVVTFLILIREELPKWSDKALEVFGMLAEELRYRGPAPLFMLSLAFALATLPVIAFLKLTSDRRRE